MISSNLVAIVFAALAVLSFIAWITATLYVLHAVITWAKRHSDADLTKEQLDRIDVSVDNLTTSVSNLVSEIKQNRE